MMMSAELTQAVLRDVLFVAMLALGLALVFYYGVRLRTGLNWNGDGNVLTRPYDGLDGVVGLGLVCFFGWMVLMSGQKPEEPLDETAFAVGLFFNTLFLLALAALIVAYMSVVRKMNPAEMFGLRSMGVGTALRQGFLWVFCAGFLIVLLMAALGWIWGETLPDASEQEVVSRFREMDGLGVRAMVVLTAVLVAPVTEELIFRGFLYGVVKRFTERWFAVAFTAVLFGLVHGHVGSLPPLVLLAVGFAVAYEATGSLLVPVFMHMIFNAVNVLRMVTG